MKERTFSIGFERCSIKLFTLYFVMMEIEVQKMNKKTEKVWISYNNYSGWIIVISIINYGFYFKNARRC